MGIKMKDRDASRALLSAYHRSIARYQKLLKTHVTDVERNYIKERLSACQAAVQAIIGPESTTIWSSSYRAESRKRTMELR